MPAFGLEDNLQCPYSGQVSVYLTGRSKSATFFASMVAGLWANAATFAAEITETLAGDEARGPAVAFQGGPWAADGYDAT